MQICAKVSIVYVFNHQRYNRNKVFIPTTQIGFRMTQYHFWRYKEFNEERAFIELTFLVLHQIAVPFSSYLSVLMKALNLLPVADQ